MTRPSARPVPPERTERTGSGHRSADPYSRLPEETLVRHTGRTPAQVTADVERDRFPTAPQVVEYGPVDAIVRGRGGRAGVAGAR